mgnify:CR=1 FL=1
MPIGGTKPTTSADLVSSHARVRASLAAGWATALRPLILDLCQHARATRWLFDARLVARQFSENLGDTDDDARRRLEMMVFVYFTNTDRGGGAPFSPTLGAHAPALVNQLLTYSLHGTTTMPDDQLAAALGCPKAHAALAVGNGGRPWG